MRDKSYWMAQALLFLLAGLALAGFTGAAGMLLFLGILQWFIAVIVIGTIARTPLKGKFPWPYKNISPRLNLFLDLILTSILFVGGFWFIGIVWMMSCLFAACCYDTSAPDDDEPRVNQRDAVAGGDIVGRDKFKA